MYYRTRTRGRLGTPPPRTYEQFTMPASVGGVNALDSLMGMPATDCLYTYNLMPSEYGLRLRKGYREWAKGITGEVRTIIGFEGQAADDSADRMWAVSQNGIYNITLDGTINPAPDAGAPFPIQNEQAGFGVYTEFTNDAAERYLQYADGVNGLFEYSETTQAWSVPAGITGPTVANIAFVANWKNRLWYIEEDSADAWYLPPDSNAGVATKFTFGSKFTNGGNLMGLWSWTVDGGDGVDDFLVAVSRGGDVLVYQGSDPTQPDFGLRGSYFIGEMTASRRHAIEYGPDLYILSVYGLTSIRELLQGEITYNQATGPAAKISRPLRARVQAGKDDYNWSMHINPSDGFLQVITPFEEVIEAVQYSQNLLTSGWGQWRGVPANCAEHWSGEYFLGTKDGQVFLYDGALDGTLLDGTLGEPVNFEILTSYQSGGDHGSYKRVGFIRPIGIIAGTAALNIAAVYDYNVNPNIADPPNLPPEGESLWDDADWDVGVWDFSLQSRSLPIGASGVGRVVAVAMRGSSSARFTLVGWDVTYERGSFL